MRLENSTDTPPDIVEFDFSESDAAAAARFAFDLDPEVRVVMRRDTRSKVATCVVLVLFIALTGAGLGSLLRGGRSPSAMFVGLTLGCLTGLAVSLRLILNKRAITNAREKYVAWVLRRLDASELGRRQVSMRPEGVFQNGACWEGTVRWKGVDQIVEQPNFIFVALRSRNAYCIPTRAFRDDAAAARFAAAGRAFQHEAGESREQRAVSFASSQPVKCSQCQYDLTGTAQVKCPECGRDLDIDELTATKTSTRPASR